MAIIAIHPGEHLSEELDALDMTAASLARNLGVPTNRVTQILNGTRAVTGDTALRLGHFFGTSAQFWLNLQSLYELRVAEQRAGKSIKMLPRLARRKSLEAAKPGPDRVNVATARKAASR
jgi:antitoxin HigA-1